MEFFEIDLSDCFMSPQTYPHVPRCVNGISGYYFCINDNGYQAQRFKEGTGDYPHKKCRSSCSNKLQNAGSAAVGLNSSMLAR